MGSVPSAKIELCHLRNNITKSTKTTITNNITKTTSTNNITITIINTILGRLNTDEESEVLNKAGARVYPEFQNPSSGIQEDERR